MRGSLDHFFRHWAMKSSISASCCSMESKRWSWLLALTKL